MKSVFCIERQSAPYGEWIIWKIFANKEAAEPFLKEVLDLAKGAGIHGIDYRIKQYML